VGLQDTRMRGFAANYCYLVKKGMVRDQK